MNKVTEIIRREKEIISKMHFFYVFFVGEPRLGLSAKSRTPNLYVTSVTNDIIFYLNCYQVCQ